MRQPWKSTLWIAGAVLAAAAAAATPAPERQTQPENQPKPQAVQEEPTPYTGRGTEYPGSLFVFQMKQITVVYPAGPGENVAWNRRSAERRAAFLRNSYKVDAQVAPDDGVTPEQLRGNLLLLGWANRLLGTDRAPRPFRATQKGLLFLGIHHVTAGADLLFFARSPYNPDRFLTFWSRINPELDRFQVLPLLGSDWAVFEDFLVVRQGMFEPGRDWPPHRNPEAEADHTRTIYPMQARMQSFRHGHYEVRFDPSRISKKDVKRVAEVREAALARAAKLLGLPVPSESFRVQLQLFADAKAKEELTGVKAEAHSLPSRRTSYLTLRTALSDSPHEEIHLLARKAFGPCYLTLFYEGLALDLTGRYRGMDLDLIGAVQQSKNRLPLLADLLNEEVARLFPADVRYPLSGLVVRWIRATYGDQAVAAAYGLEDGTVDALASALDVDVDALRKGFPAWVAARARERAADLKFLDFQAQAQQRYLDGDYKSMATLLAKALEYRPADPQTLFNLASALMRTGDYAGAATRLRKLLESAPAESRYGVFGHYQLGRVYDLQGKREQALAEYRKVLSLPDLHDSHQLAREAIKTPVTPDRLE